MRLTFGDCAIDSDRRQVTRGGRAVTLSPKAYQLLTLLLEARPRALSKDALYGALWPDTFVVEANLSNLIGEIRAALGESAQTPRVIRTLHGFGYAFAAEVADDGAEPPGYLVLGDGQARPLHRAETVVGRGPDAQVRLEGPGLSRRHARIVATDAGLVLEDLGSKNGTFVRGERVTAPRALVHGDEVAFGSVRVTLVLPRSDESTETFERG